MKTFGSNNQIKVTTSYLIEKGGDEAEKQVEGKLMTGLSKISDNKATILSSQKVGPTIANDIKKSAVWAIVLSLAAVFFYIYIRFKRWQFSTGAIASLVHDSIVILGAYSLLKNVMPFNMEINQDFIAAILTVLGYSINDTVIIFDRIREYLREKKSLTLAGLFDDSISSTLGRTFNTSFTTILVILAIFIFGGDNLRGFMFAMLIGIGFGTYSSIFVASAIAYDFLKTGKEEEVHGKSTTNKEVLASK